MKNLRLNQKLIAGFGLILGIFASVGVVVSHSLQGVRAGGEIMRTHSIPGMFQLASIRKLSNANFLLAQSVALTEDPAARDRLEVEMTENTRQRLELFPKYEALIDTPELRGHFDELKRATDSWSALKPRIFAAANANDQKEARRILNVEGAPIRAAFDAAMKALFASSESGTRETADAIVASATAMATILWGGIALTLAFGIIVALVIARSITRPVASLVEHVTRVGQGDLASRCDYSSRDEIGQLSDSLNRMTGDLKMAQGQEAVRTEQDRETQRELQMKVDSLLSDVRRIGDGDLTQQISVKGADAIGQLGEGIEHLSSELNRNMSAIAHNAQTLAASAEELSATSQQMASNSEETSNQAGSVSSAAEQVSKNVQTVATAGDEMTASIKEIAKNAHEATKVTMTAVEVVRSANATISKLGDSSMEIGKVIKVITSIAEQTNLLALNATIEAARAGEAGKGFAVVANEVKELAKETAKATEDISLKVDAIQGDTAAAVKAVEEIRGIINQVNDIATTIAGAVEEQTATTNEIGRSVSEASRGATEIARNISGVAQASQNTAAGAGATLTAASSLAQLASELQAVVGRFKLDGRPRATAQSVALRSVNGAGRGNGTSHRSNGSAA